MSSPKRIVGLVLILLSMACALDPAWAAAKSKPPQNSASQFVDGIVAVVDRQVITLNQLKTKSEQVKRQMQIEGIPVPKQDVLQRQVLQQMINAILLDNEADRIGIRVTDGQVEQAINSIIQRNHINLEILQREVKSTGMSWEDYRQELRNQIKDDMLRQRFVDEHVFISDRDVEAFLAANSDLPVMPPNAKEPEPAPQPAPPPPKPSGPELVELAQILVEVPDYATEAVVQEKRQQAQALLQRIKSGADFAGVAAASSDGPQALDGGNMGIRPLKDWPDLFIKAIGKTPPGGVSGIIQSGRGFHILKVLRRGYAQAPGQQQARAPAPPPRPVIKPVAASSIGPVMVEQTHARHILIKTSQVVNDDKARATLATVRNRVANGESFEELAKRFSEDASAPQGGDLGWLNPGDTVPAFEQAMDALKDGQVSEPIKSPFGWHLIQVVERRAKDMKDDYINMQARNELLQRRIGPAYEDWLDQLRSQAYIDNRLEKPSINYD